jgi:hypothetical protein
MTEKIRTLDGLVVDLNQVLLWQYNEAARLQGLIESKALWSLTNNTCFLVDWFERFFDLTTATTEGLVVWSIILDVPLYLTTEPSPPSYPAFGFDPFGGNFFNYNFATENSSLSGLTVEDRRTILKIRYYQLVTRATVPEINFMISKVFGSGYVLDNLDMTMTYVLPFASSSLIEYLKGNDILPKPAGVQYNVIQTALFSFGFAGFQSNFDNSNFQGATP